jgi:hypothetical protein
MSTQSGIYAIRNIVNGRVYVGSAVNLPKRWLEHKRQLGKGAHHCAPLQHAWVKHRETAFVFEFIEAVERNKKTLESREQVHLDEAFATGRPYNTCRKAHSRLGVTGSPKLHEGERFGRLVITGFAGIRPVGVDKSWNRPFYSCLCDCGRRTTVVQQKLKNGHTKSCGCLRGSRASRRTRWIEFNGKRLTLAGWARALGTNASVLLHRLAHWPLERALTELVGMGRRVRSAEATAKQAAAIRGRKLSAEHCAKVGAALRGRKKSAEHIAKLRAAGLRTWTLKRRPAGTPPKLGGEAARGA